WLAPSLNRALIRHVASAYDCATPCMIDQRRLLGTVGVLSILTVSVASGLARQQPAAGEPHGFLRTVAGFTAAELGRLDRGRPVAKVLDTDRREVAVVGAVRVAGSQAK